MNLFGLFMEEFKKQRQRLNYQLGKNILKSPFHRHTTSTIHYI